MSCGCNDNDQTNNTSGFDTRPCDPAPITPVFNIPSAGCGCDDQSDASGGGCPTEEYETGGFSLVVRNRTTGKCQWVDLDFIRDDQDNYYPAPPIIDYNPDVITMYSQDTMSPAIPESTGGPITSYSIDGSLPGGLSFDTTTGTISGTATGSPTDTVYTVTAHGPGGTGSTTIELIVQYQPLIIDNGGAIAYEDSVGVINPGESRTYDYVSVSPNTLFVDNRGYWYWFAAINSGDTFYMQSETPQQVLANPGVIPNGQWYFDRMQGDLSTMTQLQMAFNRSNGGVNHIAIGSAVILVTNSNPSFRNTLTRFQICRVSDNAVMWDGLTAIQNNNTIIVSPFVPVGASEFYYIKVAGSHNYIVNVHASSITGGGSGGAYNKVFNITSGNWNAAGANNTFGAPLQIQLI